jgi:hypothetical protein
VETSKTPVVLSHFPLLKKSSICQVRLGTTVRMILKGDSKLRSVFTFFPQEATEQPMAFELALTNADKGSLDAETVAQRVAQFAPGGVGAGLTLLLTTAPTFIEKTAALPGTLLRV